LLGLSSLRTEQTINTFELVNSADAFRELERSRLRALVQQNMRLARQLHALDFQLITPTGHVYRVEQYLGEIETGQLKYLAWDPQEMEVRMHTTVTLLRYQAKLEVDSGTGQPSTFHCWHTDSYELLNGPLFRSDRAGRDNKAPNRSRAIRQQFAS
jgi:hypothetical protein